MHDRAYIYIIITSDPPWALSLARIVAVAPTPAQASGGPPAGRQARLPPLQPPWSGPPRLGRVPGPSGLLARPDGSPRPPRVVAPLALALVAPRGARPARMQVRLGRLGAGRAGGGGASERAEGRGGARRRGVAGLPLSDYQRPRGPTHRRMPDPFPRPAPRHAPARRTSRSRARIVPRGSFVAAREPGRLRNLRRGHARDIK